MVAARRAEEFVDNPWKAMEARPLQAIGYRMQVRSSHRHPRRRLVVVALGGGLRAQDPVDHAVGLTTAWPASAATWSAPTARSPWCTPARRHGWPSNGAAAGRIPHRR